MTNEQLQLVQAEMNSICYQFFMEHATEVLQDAVDRVSEDEGIDLTEALEQLKVSDIDVTLTTK